MFGLHDALNHELQLAHSRLILITAPQSDVQVKTSTANYMEIS